VRVWGEIRRAGFVTGCALALTCACTLVTARQSSASDAATKKAATTTAVAHAKSAVQPVNATKSKTHTGKRSRRKRVRGQQKIDSERAQAIQEALIREHYLKGEATGTWNQASEEAMRRYQADHGWQSKTVPDSRALIKLGLGPSKDHLLNPESAMTTVPDAPRAESVPTTSPSASPTSSHSAPPTSDPPPPPNPNQNDPTRPQ
jgi:hypothetical protein